MTGERKIGFSTAPHVSGREGGMGEWCRVRLRAQSRPKNRTSAPRRLDLFGLGACCLLLAARGCILHQRYCAEKQVVYGGSGTSRALSAAVFISMCGAGNCTLFRAEH